MFEVIGVVLVILIVAAFFYLVGLGGDKKKRSRSQRATGVVKSIQYSLNKYLGEPGYIFTVEAWPSESFFMVFSELEKIGQIKTGQKISFELLNTVRRSSKYGVLVRDVQNVRVEED